MPKITNNHGIPEAFRIFNEKNAHSTEGAEFSVTQLIDAPQISYLNKLHDDEIEVDISSQVMAILGTAIHEILQHGATEDDVPERRFHAEILGRTVSGQCDLMSPLVTDDDNSDRNKWVLKDYKSVRGAALIINPNGQDSWEKQINSYAYLAKVNGFDVEEAEVIAIVRDWTAALVRRNAEFPRSPVIRVPIKLWSFDEQKAFLEQRVRDHTSEDVRPCTDEERWKGRTVYAVMKYLKNGGLAARATKLFNSSTEAELYIIENDLNAEVHKREPVPTRCVGNYCGVSQFCQQFMNE